MFRELNLLEEKEKQKNTASAQVVFQRKSLLFHTCQTGKVRYTAGNSYLQI